MKKNKLNQIAHILYVLFVVITVATIMNSGCVKEGPSPKAEPLNAQVRVQVAYDASDVAFRFVWKSQTKTMPANAGNTGKKYPGQYHDMLKHNGTRFDRIPSDGRLQEDRVTFMIDKLDQRVPGFSTATCAATCHSGMSSHNLLTENVVDHWHWRGGRSGPMGYAEDAAVDHTGRIRDNLGTSPSRFLRSSGDRFREDQGPLTGTGHAVLTDGLPRFVFNKGKAMPGDFTIPSFFITDHNNTIITNPYTEIPNNKSLSNNRSLLVVHQDKTFDPVDKVNAIDVGYLAYVALSSVAHLPAHLQDTGSETFVHWRNFWASELGIAANASAAALAKLNAIHQEWVASNKNAMVTRSVAFIYNSDQHDITSERAYNASRDEWTVILYRKLATGSDRDADLSGLPAGTRYAFSFAMHDVGGAAISHHISMPYVISNGVDSDIVAKQLPNINDIDWDVVPYFDTYYVKQAYVDDWKWTEGWLRSSLHPGGSVYLTSTCVSCHQDKLYSGLLN